MSCAFIGDVANVVRIETLGSTPLIVDEPGFSLDRPFSLRSRLVESPPGNLLPQAAHHPSTPRTLEMCGKEAVDLGIRHQARQSSEAAV